MLRRAGEVPVALIDEIADRMAPAMSGSAESRRCAGLSFAYVITDRRLPRLRYAVGDGGAVTLTRDDPQDATFTFSGDADTFDAILRGHAGALGALLGGRVKLKGSLWHIRGLLRMMPTVERAYVASRDATIEGHSDRYDFRF